MPLRLGNKTTVCFVAQYSSASFSSPIKRGRRKGLVSNQPSQPVTRNILISSTLIPLFCNLLWLFVTKVANFALIFVNHHFLKCWTKTKKAIDKSIFSLCVQKNSMGARLALEVPTMRCRVWKGRFMEYQRVYIEFIGLIIQGFYRQACTFFQIIVKSTMRGVYPYL